VSRRLAPAVQPSVDGSQNRDEKIISDRHRR
jgi:hypothetical protein